MSRIAVVTNATGTQGCAVVRALSQANYQVRALTRSCDKSHFKDLKNVTLVECNVEDIDSVRRAFEGAEVVYVCSIVDDEKFIGISKEGIKFGDFEHGKRFTDVAKEVFVERFVWTRGNGSEGRWETYYHKEKCGVQHELVHQDLALPFVLAYRPTNFERAYTAFGIESDLARVVLLSQDFEKIGGKTFQVVEENVLCGGDIIQIITRPSRYVRVSKL